jgi:hypothetical protein
MIDLSDLIGKRGLITKVMEDKVQEVKTKIVLDVERGCKEGSPVDTNEFRGNWQANLPERPFENGSVTNNTPYGPFLLSGHSSQAPAGWVDNVVEAAAQLGRK